MARGEGDGDASAGRDDDADDARRRESDGRESGDGDARGDDDGDADDRRARVLHRGRADGMRGGVRARAGAVQALRRGAAVDKCEDAARRAMADRRGRAFERVLSDDVRAAVEDAIARCRDAIEGVGPKLAPMLKSSTENLHALLETSVERAAAYTGIR